MLKEDNEMKKLISLILAFLLIVSVLPISVFAFSPAEYKVIEKRGDKWFGLKDGEVLGSGGKDITKEYAKYLADQAAEEGYDHDPGDHEYTWAHNLKYHWLQCPCGCKISMEHHVDPKTTADDYCTCGYHFSDNADLVTLWLQDCEGIYDFRSDVTEYEIDAFSYKDVKEIKRISTRTHSAGATVELPEDLTLKEGENRIEIKVTAENQKVTKTYTVIVNKAAK